MRAVEAAVRGGGAGGHGHRAPNPACLLSDKQGRPTKLVVQERQAEMGRLRVADGGFFASNFVRLKVRRLGRGPPPPGCRQY